MLEFELTPIFCEMLIKNHKLLELDLSFSNITIAQLVKFTKALLEPEEPRDPELEPW
jgi:hypothetical protein